MKSIENERQASAAIGKGRRGACDDGYGFTRWQISHARFQLRIHLYISDQKKPRDTAACLFAAPVYTNRDIMVLVDDTSTQIHVSGSNRTRDIELVDAVQEQISVQNISLDVIALSPR